MPPKVAGYHYQRTDEGALVIQEDEPCGGMTTLTWVPTAESPTTRGVAVMPSLQFAAAVESYVAERKTRAKTAAPAG